MLYAYNHFKLEIYSALLKTSDPNLPFPLAFLQYKDTAPEQSQKQGFEIYLSIRPVSIPSQTYSGIFGHLFGVIFKENNKIQVRCISALEYLSMYSYSSTFTSHLTLSPPAIPLMRSCVPAKASNHILQRACNDLDKIQRHRLEAQSKRVPEAELSHVSIFNGSISSELPSHEH